MSKKSNPRDDQTIRTPQTEGQSGWLILQRNPKPEVLFVIRSQLSAKAVPYVIDERCFDDTIIRVEKTNNVIYLADVYVWQGVPVHATKSFEERQELLANFLRLFYTSCKHFEWLPLQLRSQATCKIKGYEYYSNDPGDIGSFTEDNRILYTILKTDISDIYAIEGEPDGYLDVPTMDISLKLRSMGDRFQLYCKKTSDLWEIIAFNDK